VAAFVGKLNVDKLGIAGGYCNGFGFYCRMPSPEISGPAFVAAYGSSLNSWADVSFREDDDATEKTFSFGTLLEGIGGTLSYVLVCIHMAMHPA
jgi:hypothetical protein